MPMPSAMPEGLSVDLKKGAGSGARGGPGRGFIAVVVALGLLAPGAGFAAEPAATAPATAE
ncbi:MAG TPA: hypothetical protein VIU29_04890, partial [Candidatus Deferrimicrobiaceae bacterium]